MPKSINDAVKALLAERANGKHLSSGEAQKLIDAIEKDEQTVTAADDPKGDPGSGQP